MKIAEESLFDYAANLSRVHANSINALAACRNIISGRRAEVYSWLHQHGPATDREIMAGLGYHEPNQVRPRVTELVDAGIIKETGNRVDPMTNVRVRIVEVV